MIFGAFLPNEDGERDKSGLKKSEEKKGQPIKERNIDAEKVK